MVWMHMVNKLYQLIHFIGNITVLYPFVYLHQCCFNYFHTWRLLLITAIPNIAAYTRHLLWACVQGPHYYVLYPSCWSQNKWWRVPTVNRKKHKMQWIKLVSFLSGTHWNCNVLACLVQHLTFQISMFLFLFFHSTDWQTDRWTKTKWLLNPVLCLHMWANHWQCVSTSCMLPYYILCVGPHWGSCMARILVKGL